MDTSLWHPRRPRRLLFIFPSISIAFVVSTVPVLTEAGNGSDFTSDRLSTFDLITILGYMRLGLRKDVFVMDYTKHIPSKVTAARARLDEIVSYASAPKFPLRMRTQDRVDCLAASDLVEVLRIVGHDRGHLTHHALQRLERNSDPGWRAPCHG
jgi:hypothetical protein